RSEPRHDLRRFAIAGQGCGRTVAVSGHGRKRHPTDSAPAAQHQARKRSYLNISADRLPDQLARGLAASYVVVGDEPLAGQEAADAIRAAARAAGHSERTVHTVQGRYNWQGLFASGDNFSLFAERRLTEIRIPSGKPGVDGDKALETYASRLPEDTLTLISLP